MYQRTCPVYRGVCQAPLAAFNTGTLNALNTNTTSTYYNASAPVYYMAGNAGRSAPDPTFLEDFTQPYYQNLNIKYGYVRLRANGTTLITDVSAHSLLNALGCI